MGMEKSFMLFPISVNHTSTRCVSGQSGCQQVALETEQELISCMPYQLRSQAGVKAHQSKRSQRPSFCSRGNCRRKELLVKRVVGCTAFIRAIMTVLQRRPFLSELCETVSAAKSKLTSCPRYPNALIHWPALVQPASENMTSVMFWPQHKWYPSCNSMYQQQEIHRKSKYALGKYTKYLEEEQKKNSRLFPSLSQDTLQISNDRFTHGSHM